MFKNNWALVTAGTPEDYNSCTVSWGSLGTVWTRQKTAGQTVTVYLHPARYTQEKLNNHDVFTVSFFPKEYKKALGYMGSHSGRNEDKVKSSGLTPIPAGEGVTFKEAELTFVCKKVYGHQLDKNSIAKEVQDYYKADPKAFPVDQNGEWQPHWLFMGEIIQVIDNR